MTSPFFKKLHDSLQEDTVLYRTLDFFSALAIVKNNQLMFSRADLFPDKNEGIDYLLTQLQASIPNSGCRMGWNDAETARKRHDEVKRSYYVSCWSKNAESVAIWSLYSPDHTSVRISTTVSKLRIPVESMLAKYDIHRLNENDLGKQVVVSISGEIAPVEYSSLSQITNKITRRVKAYNRIASRYTKTGKSMPGLTEIDPKYFKREQQRRFRELLATCHLKDTSFQHEDEVRLLVRLGEETCSKELLNACEQMEPNHECHKVLITDLQAWNSVSSVSLPEREFAKCGQSNLVDTVAIDPRGPDYKAKFIQDWFKGEGVKIVKSECFRYLPDWFEVYPER